MEETQGKTDNGVATGPTRSANRTGIESSKVVEPTTANSWGWRWDWNGAQAALEESKKKEQELEQTITLLRGRLKEETEAKKKAEAEKQLLSTDNQSLRMEVSHEKEKFQGAIAYVSLETAEFNDKEQTLVKKVKDLEAKNEKLSANYESLVKKANTSAAKNKKLNHDLKKEIQAKQVAEAKSKKLSVENKSLRTKANNLEATTQRLQSLRSLSSDSSAMKHLKDIESLQKQVDDLTAAKQRLEEQLRASNNDIEDDEVQIVTIRDVEDRRVHMVANDNEDDEVQIVSEVGNNALVNFPHARCHCVAKSFGGNKKDHCEKCLCYVCDVPVSKCKHWKEHCEATDQEKKWNDLRVQFRETKCGPNTKS